MIQRPPRTRRLLLMSYALLAYLFLYLPLANVMLYSFNTSRLFIWPPEGIGLGWYRALVENEALLESLTNSFQISAIATVVATALGTTTALALQRLPDRARRVLQSVFLVPLLVPGMVTGLGLLLFFTTISMPLSKSTIVAGHIAFVTPIVLFVVSARLRNIGPRLPYAARDLGATPWKAFLWIQLPLIRTAVLGGALLAFTLSFDEVILTFLLTGTDNTLPVQIYSMLRFGVSPEVNAIYTIILLLSGIVVLASLRLTRQSPMNAASRTTIEAPHE